MNESDIFLLKKIIYLYCDIFQVFWLNYLLESLFHKVYL